MVDAQKTQRPTPRRNLARRDPITYPSLRNGGLSQKPTGGVRVAVVGASPLTNLLIRDLGEVPQVDAVLDARGDRSRFNEVTVVVGCWDSDPEQEKIVAAGVLASGTPYVSCSVSLEAFQALSDLEHTPANGLVVKSMSFSPGLTNLMLKFASRELDSVGRIKVSWCASTPGRSLLAQVHRSSRDAVIFEDKNWRLEQADSKEEDVYFPAPLGWRRVRLFAGAEVLSIPHSFPGLETMSVKGDFGSTWDRAAGGVRGRLIAGMGWSAARVDVSGQKDGFDQTVTYGLVDETNNAMVAPAITAVLLIAEARNLATGVLAPEEAFDAVDFFSRLAERGVRLAKMDESLQALGP